VIGLALAAATSCQGAGEAEDARLDGPTPSDAHGDVARAEDSGPDAGADLAARADAILGPAFAATPTSLDECVGGVAVLVTADAELVRGWGATELGGARTPDGTTLFQIGSLTKVFTGLAVARLIEDGAFSADTPAGELLAADLRDAVPSWPSMVALLSHHGGLPTFPSNLVDRDGDGLRDPGIDPRSPAAGYGRLELRASLAGWSPLPDEPYRYSNVGVGLAGLAVQDHLGLTGHDEVLRRLVTGDLGMRDTWGEVAAIPAAERGRLAAGHVVEGTSRAPGIPGEMGVLASAGEIVTSARDMQRLLRALLGLDATPLAGAIARATAPAADGPEGRAMGYAVEIEESAGRVRYRKGGNTSSYAAYLIWSTSPPAGVALLTNCGGFMRVVDLAAALHDAAQAP
jgi:CubicO group peptidase (beta-lactamase class C family)